MSIEPDSSFQPSRSQGGDSEDQHRWHLLDNVERRMTEARQQRARVARNLNEVEAELQTLSVRLADTVTRVIGSWPFILAQSGLLAAWIVLNGIAWRQHWDPYPFILLNLVLSFQAAYAAPIIMMSQNRQAQKDRLAAEEDYRVNLRAELELEELHRRLDEHFGQQRQTLLALHQQHAELRAQLDTLTEVLHRLPSLPTHEVRRDGTASRGGEGPR